MKLESHRQSFDPLKIHIHEAKGVIDQRDIYTIKFGRRMMRAVNVVCDGLSSIKITLPPEIIYRNKKKDRYIREKISKTLALHLSFFLLKRIAPFNIFYRARRIPALRAIYSPPRFTPAANVFAFTFRAVSRRSRLRESFYRAVSEGTRCERRTTSGLERASLFAPGGNSIRRPTDLAVARDFHGVTRFPADITFDIYGGVGEGPISHGRLELRPYATGISRVPERDG